MPQRVAAVYHDERMVYVHCMIHTGSRLTAEELKSSVYFMLAQGMLIMVWAVPDFPEGPYGIFFSFFIVVIFSCPLFTFVPTSWVPSFAHMWSTSKAAYDRVRNAGNKAWVYVLGNRT